MTDEEMNKWMRRISDGHTADLPRDIVWVGQPHVIAQIKPFIEAKKQFPHTLILGEPGLGKTNLAKWIAQERVEPFEELLAPVSVEDMPMTGIVLIDEVHLQRTPERLFKFMLEESVSVLAASTRPENIDKAFRSRFFFELHLHRYTVKEMRELITMEIETTEEMLDILSSASAGNPRQAKKLAEFVRFLDEDDPARVLEAAQISADGLTGQHMEYLKVLLKVGKPVGLTQLSTSLYSDEGTVRGLEPLLLDENLIEYRPNGRALTRKGKNYAQGL